MDGRKMSKLKGEKGDISVPVMITMCYRSKRIYCSRIGVPTKVSWDCFLESFKKLRRRVDAQIWSRRKSAGFKCKKHFICLRPPLSALRTVSMTCLAWLQVTKADPKIKMKAKRQIEISWLKNILMMFNKLKTQLCWMLWIFQNLC